MAMSKLCSPQKRLPHENALLVDASNKKQLVAFCRGSLRFRSFTSGSVWLGGGMATVTVKGWEG